MTEFTTPVGRFVMGSLTTGQDKDAEGRPLVYKTGPDAGKPRFNYFFAIAIPKGAEKHWAETPWGAAIWAKGHGAFPGGQAQSPSFAWKVEDGDNVVPNKAGHKNSEREGFPGNWILKWSSGFAPSTFWPEGKDFVPAPPESIKPGYFIQVNGSVAGNGSQSQPGVFLNHSKVAFAAFGPEIVFTSDVSAAGFGGAPLPAGASAVPLGGFAPPPSAAPAPVSAPAAPAPQFLQPPPAAPAHQMTALANGVTYEAMIAAGWDDAQLVQHKMMVG